jgi:hypothetical protein
MLKLLLKENCFSIAHFNLFVTLIKHDHKIFPHLIDIEESVHCIFQKILSTDAHVHNEHETGHVNKGRTINEEGVETETGTIVFTL